MIESFFHQLKNRYLYYKKLDVFPTLEKHFNFYIKEHNTLH